MKTETHPFRAKSEIAAIPCDRVDMKPFHIQTHLVTVGQWREVTGKAFMPYNDRRSKKFPVVGPSFDDARNFARKVGGRLPTLREWTYLASYGADPFNFEKWLETFGDKIDGGIYSPFGVSQLFGYGHQWLQGDYDDGKSKHSALAGTIRGKSPYDEPDSFHPDRFLQGSALPTHRDQGCSFRVAFDLSVVDLLGWLNRNE